MVLLEPIVVENRVQSLHFVVRRSTWYGWYSGCVSNRFHIYT